MNLRLFDVKNKGNRFAGTKVVAETAEEAVNFIWPQGQPSSPHARKRENLTAKDVTDNYTNLGPIFAKNRKGCIVYGGKATSLVAGLPIKNTESFGWVFVDEIRNV